jgi:hypothetical protein
MKDAEVVHLLREYANQLVIAVSDSHGRIQRNEEKMLAPVLEVVQKLRDDADVIEEEINDGKR